MKETDSRKINRSKIEPAIKLPSFLSNKSFSKILDKMMPKGLHLLDFAQVPLLKMFKHFGAFLRLLDLGTPETDVTRMKEYLIPLHDGAKVATDVYIPKKVLKNKGKAPTILVRLPYWKKVMNILGYLFASKGYVTVLQDMRGCASSVPYGSQPVTFLERYDGMETLKWITKQFWYNQKIGMWGISFLGVTQLAVSWNNPLVTCFNPIQCSYTSVLYHPGGLNLLGMGIDIFKLILGITQNKDPTMSAFNAMLKSDPKLDLLLNNPLLSLYNDPIDTDRYLLYLSKLTKIKDEKELTEIINKTFNLNAKFSERDTEDTLKKFLTEAVLKRKINMNYEYLPYAFGFDGRNLDTPMFAVGSWHDMFIEQFLSDLKLIQKNSPDFFKNKFRMVIGSGAHGGMDMIPSMGFPPQTIDVKKMFTLYQYFLNFSWHDYWLKKNGKDLSKIPRIRMYILNKKVWRNFDKWPPDVNETKLYLHSNGKANSRFGNGKLSESESKEEPSDKYDFDPSNPVLTTGGRFLFYTRSGQRNQIKLEERKDVLIYTTEKLRQGIEVIGDVKIVFYASSSANDTDFTVKLVDVYNNKVALNVIDNGIRARFRDGLENPSLLESGKIYKYELTIGAIGIYFPKGHRIRLEISSSNFPRFDVNSNLAGEQSEKKYIIANQQIFHDSEHPSQLILPVFREK